MPRTTRRTRPPATPITRTLRERSKINAPHSALATSKSSSWPGCSTALCAQAAPGFYYADEEIA